MKNFSLISELKNQEFLLGVEYTRNSFLQNELIYFHKSISTFKVSPSTYTETYYSTYYIYNIEENICEQIESKTFYEAYFEFIKVGLSKKEETYLYDKAIDNSFVMYILLTSKHI